MARWWWLGLALWACEPENSDLLTEGDDRPDITGTYTLTVSEPHGCPDRPEADPGWLNGSLAIEGPAEALRFHLPDGTTLDGSVDAAFTWEASGPVERPEVTLDLYLDGLAYIGDDTWILDGEGTLDLLDSTQTGTLCTLTVLVEASQVP